LAAVLRSSGNRLVTRRILTLSRVEAVHEGHL